ncbi:MAG: metallophosphoesterase [Nocardiopsaceae bacterium]|nr:metallophosphoesterase [Nocardiopsaceae bacterium]
MDYDSADPLPDVAGRLDVPVPPGGTVIAFSDLHLPPERTDVSGRCCEVLARRLDAIARRLDNEPGRLTVVLAGDIVEMLAYPGASATGILDAHQDLGDALARVTERGGRVVYTAGNHDGDLAWDLKTAKAIRDATGASLCLSADLRLPGGQRIRVEHGHQLDPYNCFRDPRNALDTPLGHHIVREVIPKIEWLGRDWLNGAHEMADPADFPSFLASRLVYRKLSRHLWWLTCLPVLLFGVILPQVSRFGARYPDAGAWLHDAGILGYGAVADIAIIALIVALVTRRAWTSISALALAERGYGQNAAARERADELIARGYAGYVSGHTHHPELRAHGKGFYANSGSCTSVVEAIDTMRGLPPVYLRAQQLSWLEISAGDEGTSGQGTAGQGTTVRLHSARVEMPGATAVERFVARARNPHAAHPCAVAAWPAGPDWPSGRVRQRPGNRKKS